MSLPPVDFPTLGWLVIDWIEANLCHGKGDLMGQPITIDDEMALHICHAYRLDSDGKRVFDLVVLARAKGRAKSEIAAAVACAELCPTAPVRFSHWDKNGEPVGRSVRSPFIRCLATEESQAGNTYEGCYVMLRDGAVAQQVELDVGLTRTFLPGGDGEIRPSTSGAASKDGGKETHAVGDEVHLYITPETRTMFDLVSNNMTKRPIAEPWMHVTTTAFAPGEDSVAEQLHDEFAAMTYEQCMEQRVLWNWVEGPEVQNWDDDDEVMASVRIAYGAAAAWADFNRILRRMRKMPRARAERFYCNRVRRSESGWITPDEWRLEELVVQGYLPPDDALIALGFDGSLFDDSTGLLGCEVETGIVFVIDAWEKPEGPAGDLWEVDPAVVDAAVDEAFRRWDVWRMYGDPPLWQDSLDKWRARYGPQVVVDWWTNRDRQMAAAVERFETAVRTKTMRHSGDARLTRHIGHCRVRSTRTGRLIVKDRPRSPKKIDLAVCAVLAYECRMDAIAAKAHLDRRRRRRKTGGKARAAGF